MFKTNTVDTIALLSSCISFWNALYIYIKIFPFIYLSIQEDLKGRIGLESDIPRDLSGLKKAGFRLPLPEDQVDDYDGAVIIEAADEVNI